MANGGGPDAFTFVIVADDFPDRIESICPHKDRVHAGFSDGSIATLEPELELHELGPWRIEKRVKGSARRPIIQLEPIPSLSAIASLSTNGIDVLALPDLSPITKVDVSAATRFAWSEKASMLCVNVRRILSFYTLEGITFVESNSISIQEPVRLMAWCGEHLCFATRTRYAFADPATGQITESVMVGRGHPAMAVIADDEALLTKDNQSFYVRPDGKQRNVCITWSQSPLAIVLCEPFVVGLLDDFMEVRNKSPTARQCVIQMFNDVDRINITSASLAKDGSIFMASRERKTICRLHPTPLRQQIDELVEMNEFQDALQVAELLDDEARIKTEDDIRVSYGVNMFMNKEYEEGLMQLMMRSQRTPLLLLRLFPSLLPKEMLEGFDLPVSEEYFAKHKEPEGDDYVIAVECLLPLLIANRTRLASRKRDDLEKDMHEAALDAIDEDVEIEADDEPTMSRQSPTPPLKKSFMRSESRIKRTRLSVLVDTAIMKAMLVSPDPGTLLQFVKRENWIDVKEGERSLLPAGRYIEMSGLYESHGMHDEGLEILRRVSLEPDKLEYPPRGASSDLRGETSIWAAVRYLSNLTENDEEVINKHSAWVLKEDPEAALEVFVGAEKRLPPRIVLPILAEHAPHFSAVYLEAMLDKGDASRDEFELTLVDIYLKDAIQNEKELGALHKLATKANRFDFDQLREKSTRRLLEKNAVFHGEKDLIYDDVLKAKEKDDFLTSSEPPTPLESYTRLRELLIESPFIDPTVVLDSIPSDSLLELQALLLERQRNYRSALAVYIQRLHDLTLAEMLCDRVWEGDKLSCNSSIENVYMDMIQIYLEPEGVTDGQIRKLTDDEWRNLCVLLCRKRYRINIEEMFELLPGDVELSVLMHFVEGALKTLAQQQRNLLVVHSLYTSENLHKREQLIRCKQRSIGVTYESACCICHKRIGNAVFVAYPNDALAHIACYTRQNKTAASSSSDARSLPSRLSSMAYHSVGSEY